MNDARLAHPDSKSVSDAVSARTAPASTPAVAWDGQTAAVLAYLCAVPRVELLAETTSTQDVAHKLAEADAPSGTTVVADAQRAGRGRLGRTWSSEPGLGVWCTVIERPQSLSALEVLSVRVGLYCAEALDAFAGERVGLKWPNDLVIRKGAEQSTDAALRKLAGILVETRWSGGTASWVAIGVGVNVVQPPNVDDAVGLAAGTRRTDVLAAVVGGIRTAAAITGHLRDDEMARYRVRDVLAGRRIGSPGEGTANGIKSDGSLIVNTARGEESFRAGTILLLT